MRLGKKIAMAAATIILALPLVGVPKAKVSAATVVREGIDVAGWTNKACPNEKIDFEEVKKSGKKFVIIRCGYRGPTDSTMEKDSFFEENLKAALDAGLDVGVYYATQAVNTTQAVQEADYTINKVNEVLKQNSKYELTLPIVVDFEPDGPKKPQTEAKLSVATYNAICSAFCDRVEANGFTAMYYTNADNLQKHFTQSALSAKYPLWLARYNNNATCGNSAAVFWQYKEKTDLSNTVKNVDLNRQYINTPAMVKNVQATVKSATHTYLSWSKIPGVYGYEIYRTASNTNKETYLTTIKGAGKTKFDDKTTKKGVTYTYRVRGILKTNQGIYRGTFSYATGYKVTFHTNGGKIKSGNFSYYTYGKKANLPTKVARERYVFKGWYTDSKLKSGKTTAINAGTHGNRTYYAKWEKISLSKPTLNPLKNKKTKKMEVHIKKKVTNADGYEIKYSLNKNMKGAKKTNITKGSTLSKTISGLKKGKKYYVQVRAYRFDSTGKKQYSSASNKRDIKISK